MPTIKTGPLYLIALLLLVASVYFFYLPYYELASHEFNLMSATYIILLTTGFTTSITIMHYLSRNIHLKTLYLILIYTLIAYNSSHIIERLDFVNDFQVQQTQAKETANQIHSKIKTELYSELAMAHLMIEHLKAVNYQFSQAEFDRISENLIQASQHIKHVALAKNLQISHIYPLEGNEKALGIDYKKIKQQWPSVKKSIENQKTILAGPVNLVQGGLALIARIPLNTRANQEQQEKLWGIMSLVIDFESLLETSEIRSRYGYLITIQGKDAMGAEGDIVYGKQSILNNKPYLKPIQLPYGEWLIAVYPKTGWLQNSKYKTTIELSVGILWLITLLFTIMHAYQYKKQDDTLDALKTELATTNKDKRMANESQRQMYQAQKLEAIGQLTSGIAHDFNNILSAITGYAQLSQMILETNQNTDKLHSHIKQIIRAGDRAKSLVTQMLTFSRGRDVEAEVIEPMKVFQETLQMLHAILPASIKLQTDYHDFESHIMLDPVQLQQILVNLVVNARDAIPNSKGTITISTKLVKATKGNCSSCNKDYEGDYFSLTISDDGTGINKEQLSKVFDPFYSTKEVGKGSGMGLSVVHGIIHAANGHVSIVSQPNQGSSIELLFPTTGAPLSKTKDEVDMSPLKSKSSRGQKNILIIDDEPSITQLYDDILASRELSCITYNQPELALDYFKQNSESIAMVVTDYTMPTMNGIELIKSIRQLNDSVPVILCSGNADVVDKTVFADLNISHFLNKPVDLNKLADFIVNFMKS